MKKTLLLNAIFVLSLPALAAENTGFYGSIGAGAYRLDDGGFDETAPITKVWGGYNFNDYVAVEAAYSRLYEASERVDGVEVDIDGNVWDLSTKLSYPFTNRFSGYSRLGWSYLDLSGTATADGMTVRANEYDNAFSWAVGTGVKLTDRVAFNGEYGGTHDGNLDLLSVGVTYRFSAR